MKVPFNIEGAKIALKYTGTKIANKVVSSRRARDIAISAVIAYIITKEKRRKNGKEAFKGKF